jgi:hypothetical protein
MEVCTDLVTEYFGYFPMAKVCLLKHETEKPFLTDGAV